MKVEAIHKYRIVKELCAFIDTETHLALARSQLSTGDVLFSIAGTLGRIAVVQFEDLPANTNQAVAIIRPASVIASRFLAYALDSFLARVAVAKGGRGVGLQNLNLKQVQALPLLLPPFSEQYRVVEALDSYLSRLDAATEALKRVEANLKRYRASVLKAAVEGRLVPTEAELARAEGRDYEPASVLLERILKKRRRRWEEAELAKMKAKGKVPKNDDWKAKYKEPAAPNVSELPELPEGWCWATVEQLFWSAGYGTSVKCTVTADGPPVLRIPNIQDGSLTLHKLKFATSRKTLSSEGVLERGDFIFIRTNGSQSLIGRGAAISEELPRDYFFASYLIRLRLFSEGAFPQWFSTMWNSPTVRTQLLKDAASSAGQHNVSLGAVSRYAVPLAPFAEQERLLQGFDEGSSIAIAASKAVARDRGRIDRLRQSILKWAFEGQLVDQDSNDEPASVLLERIRAERAATGNGSKRRRAR